VRHIFITQNRSNKLRIVKIFIPARTLARALDNIE